MWTGDQPVQRAGVARVCHMIRFRHAVLLSPELMTTATRRDYYCRSISGWFAALSLSNRISKRVPLFTYSKYNANPSKITPEPLENHVSPTT